MEEEFYIYFKEILTATLKSEEILPHSKTDNMIMGGYCITEESILAIDNNYMFFKDIPKLTLKNELINLLYIINFYESENRLLRKALAYLVRKSDKRSMDKPSLEIKRDIKKLKEYEKLIKELFLFDEEKQKKYLVLNNKLIRDLENKDFNIIAKIHYYSHNSSKQPIKKIIEEIKKTHKLKNVSIEAKNLIDTLPTYTYTDEELEKFLVGNVPVKTIGREENVPKIIKKLYPKE